MVSDDSLTETDDSYFDIYSTQKVTSTYNSLLEKLKSADNASRNEVIVDEGDEEEISPYSSKDKSSGSTSSQDQVADEENDFEVVPDNLTVPPPSVENPYVRRSARLNKRQGNQASDVEAHEICPVNKRRRRKQNRNEKITEVIELSDEEIDKEDSNAPDLSLEDELNYEVSVKVLWKSVTVKTFRLRRFQKFTQVFDYFMEEEKVPYEKILLKVRDIKICANDTPDSLDLKVCDFIDGGVLSDSMVTTNKPAQIQKSSNNKNCLTIKVQDMTKTLHKFTINKDESLKVIMMKYAEQTEIPLNKIKFYFDGEVLKPGDTPTSLGMENDEIIDVKLLK